MGTAPRRQSMSQLPHRNMGLHPDNSPCPGHHTGTAPRQQSMSCQPHGDYMGLHPDNSQCPTHHTGTAWGLTQTTVHVPATTRKLLGTEPRQQSYVPTTMPYDYSQCYRISFPFPPPHVTPVHII